MSQKSFAGASIDGGPRPLVHREATATAGSRLIACEGGRKQTLKGTLSRGAKPFSFT
jgi:hypothetical protein